MAKNDDKKRELPANKLGNKKRFIGIFIFAILLIGISSGATFIITKKTVPVTETSTVDDKTKTKDKKTASKSKKSEASEEIYSSAIDADVYRIGSKGNAIKLGITVIFEDADSASIYDGIDPTAKKSSEEGTTKKAGELSFGDKNVKDITIKTLLEGTIETVSNSEEFKKLLIEKINKHYSEEFDAEIVKDIKFTSYYYR